MRNRPLLLSALTVIAGTGLTAYLLRRLPAAPDSDASTAARPAEQARAFAAAVDGTDDNGQPAGTVPTTAAAVRQSGDAAMATEVARYDFLRTAERTGDASLRLAMLVSLENEIGRAQSIRTVPGLQPFYINSDAGDSGTIRRKEDTRREYETALTDLTTLTPEARAQWDRAQATGWREDPPVPAFPPPVDPALHAAVLDFSETRAALTKPLLREYERLEELYHDIRQSFDSPSAGPAKPAAITPLLESHTTLEAARHALYESMMETERLRRTWSEKNWAGYQFAQ